MELGGSNPLAELLQDFGDVSDEIPVEDDEPQPLADTNMDLLINMKKKSHKYNGERPTLRNHEPVQAQTKMKIYPSINCMDD